MAFLPRYKDKTQGKLDCKANQHHQQSPHHVIWYKVTN